MHGAPANALLTRSRHPRLEEHALHIPCTSPHTDLPPSPPPTCRVRWYLLPPRQSGVIGTAAKISSHRTNCHDSATTGKLTDHVSRPRPLIDPGPALGRAVMPDPAQVTRSLVSGADRPITRWVRWWV